MKNSYTILYVDDDHDDLYLITEAFLQFADKLKVVHAFNGLEGIRALEDMKKQHSLPCLVILDINMPVMNGKEVLKHIKSSQDFKELPVVLFSTSNNPRDQQFAEEWDADFITKPVNFQDMETMVKAFVSKCVFSVEEKV
jgi:CheY-like chemotaxis protein